MQIATMQHSGYIDYSMDTKNKTKITFIFRILLPFQTHYFSLFLQAFTENLKSSSMSVFRKQFMPVSFGVSTVILLPAVTHIQFTADQKSKRTAHIQIDLYDLTQE
jgi:hypothetical protein